MDIQSERDGPVLRIIFNRPERGNAFSEDMIAALEREIAEAERHARVVVLSGEGADFCAGRIPAPSPVDPIERRGWGDSVFRCYDAFRRSPIPSIAVVRGRAFGFGCAVAALSDITLADETAKFRLPEMSNNIMPANAMSALIDRLPRKTIAYLALTSEPIEAQSAKQAGLVSEVAAGPDLGGIVARVIDSMLAMPAMAISGVKEYLRAAPDMPIDGAVEFARNLHATVNSSAAMRKK